MFGFEPNLNLCQIIDSSISHSIHEPFSHLPLDSLILNTLFDRCNFKLVLISNSDLKTLCLLDADWISYLRKIGNCREIRSFVGITSIEYGVYIGLRI
jgi:hypothetical protein